MGRRFDLLSSYGVSVLRGFGGMYTRAQAGPRPERPLELYEFEGCPFCRKVREACTVLDLDVSVRPCPKGGERFRPEAIRLGGKRQFPFLVDPNSGVQLYESAEIVAHLFARYGAGSPTLWMRMPLLNTMASSAASVFRSPRGSHARPSRPAVEPLELWSFENSPFCRLARETLCELELPYLLHNVGKNSAKRADFVARSGRMMVPYLADPNTGVEMFESADIQRYLLETYGAEAELTPA